MNVHFELSAQGVARIILCRARKHNALDGDMINRLTEIARNEARSARALILAAEGESFCAGADLGWMRRQFEAAAEERLVEAQRLNAMLHAIDSLPMLVIGLVQGPAYGGGLGLASVRDVVIASPSARFALTETRLGLIPAVIAPYLELRIGAAGLRAIGLHGTVVDAERAVSMGLVSEIVREGGLEDAAARHVDQVLACAPGAVAEAKGLFRRFQDGTRQHPDTAALLAARWQTDEAQKGVSAYFAKEPPPWQSRRIP
jgi:methylglutaconyl-CoA hydratase